MIVLGKQVGEVWKIPRIPPRASPSEEYSEFPDFSSLFTQDYYKHLSFKWDRHCEVSAYILMGELRHKAADQWSAEVGLVEALVTVYDVVECRTAATRLVLSSRTAPPLASALPVRPHPTASANTRAGAGIGIHTYHTL